MDWRRTDLEAQGLSGSVTATQGIITVSTRADGYEGVGEVHAVRFGFD